MAFANRYIIQITEILNQVQRRHEIARVTTGRSARKLIAANSAIGHAVEINPLVGLMDMADMVTINQMISGEPWLGETFGPEAASQIAAALKSQEHDIWTIAAQYLTSDQMTELRALCAMAGGSSQRALCRQRPAGGFSSGKAVKHSRAAAGFQRLRAADARSIQRT